MKQLKAAVCAFSILSLFACARPYETNGPLAKAATLSTSSTDTISPLGYEISDGTCTTGHREFTTAADRCLNLQIDANNNAGTDGIGCAQSTRLAYFTKVCPNQSFQPAAALAELKSLSGIYMKCDFTSTDLISKITMTIHQETSAAHMTMLLGTGKADIGQFLKDGVYGIGVSMVANDGSGSATKTVAAKNSAPPPISIQSTSSSATLQLNCETSLQAP